MSEWVIGMFLALRSGKRGVHTWNESHGGAMLVCILAHHFAFREETTEWVEKIVLLWGRILDLM